jgi:hypothetical protein
MNVIDFICLVLASSWMSYVAVYSRYLKSIREHVTVMYENKKQWWMFWANGLFNCYYCSGIYTSCIGIALVYFKLVFLLWPMATAMVVLLTLKKLK